MDLRQAAKSASRLGTPAGGLDLIIGRSPWAIEVREQIARVAGHDSTVLITGPTGTGKELIARAVHATSPRAVRPFIPVDCTAISGTLFASQLFGHRKGAYTGANYEALGCFRAADRGTIFLDEIGDLDLELQAKLLRVIQERVVVPVGNDESVPVDVRIVAATNRDLKQDVVAGTFREDLYYRLAVVPISSAPLKHRPSDIPQLADHFLASLTHHSGMPRKELSPGAAELLAAFDWPGNVRQLRHMLEQAVVACDGPIITLPLVQQLLEQAKLPPAAQAEFRADSGRDTTLAPPESLPVAATPPTTRAADDRNWSTLFELEREHIVLTLEHTYYNQSAAARLLGITRQSLIRKVKKYGVTIPDSLRRPAPPSAK